jgi:hypothetical protein
MRKLIVATNKPCHSIAWQRSRIDCKGRPSLAGNLHYWVLHWPFVVGCRPFVLALGSGRGGRNSSQTVKMLRLSRSLQGGIIQLLTSDRKRRAAADKEGRRAIESERSSFASPRPRLSPRPFRLICTCCVWTSWCAALAKLLSGKVGKGKVARRRSRAMAGSEWLGS